MFRETSSVFKTRQSFFWRFFSGTSGYGYVGDLGSMRLVRRRKGLFSGAANDAFGNGQSGPPLAGR